MEDDWFSTARYEEQAREQSLERRRDPLATVLGFLREILLENTEEEALRMWRYRARNAPVWAEDVLWSLDRVAQSPPENLEETMRTKGQVHLYHPNDPPVRYNDREAAGWLQSLADKYRNGPKSI